jgi:pyruvate,water dikinase
VEFDAFVPTWSGQPWVVLENIRLILLRGTVEDPTDREVALRERQAAAEHRFLELLPEDLRFFAGEVLRLARAYTALDDLEHYQTTRLNVPFRRAIAALGARLAEAHVLDQGDDVFFLRKATLARLLAREIPAREAREEARRLSAEYAAARDSSPDWTLGEDAPPPAAGALRGLPGSPGRVEALAFRVLSPADFARFPAGSVLVARTTNPAWTPLFYGAAAVVTESGGPLSHGAVTAREVGVPAVMAVKGVLSLVRDGARLRVDGSRGTVEILENETA